MVLPSTKMFRSPDGIYVGHNHDGAVYSLYLVGSGKILPLLWSASSTCDYKFALRRRNRLSWMPSPLIASTSGRLPPTSRWLTVQLSSGGLSRSERGWSELVWIGMTMTAWLTSAQRGFDPCYIGRRSIARMLPTSNTFKALVHTLYPDSNFISTHSRRQELRQPLSRLGGLGGRSGAEQGKFCLSD